MKKLLLTPLFCLIGLSLFGQTFMTSFKHTFKGLSIESSGVSHIKDIACPQIPLSQFGGSGKIDGVIEGDEEPGGPVYRAVPARMRCRSSTTCR